MRKILRGLLVILAGVMAFAGYAAASDLDAATQAKVDEKTKIIAEWGKDPALVAAVKGITANPPAEVKGLTQEDWVKLTILDPKVRSFQGNAAGAFLKGKKEIWVVEAFVSVPDGTKAGFLSKTSSWSHKGKPKHDDPMSGKTWQGPLEVDESSGRKGVQVAVPVLDGATPVGSLVIGIDVSKL